MAKNQVAVKTSPQDALMQGFKDDLTQIVPYLESLLPGKHAVARFQRMAQFAVLRDQKLLECTKKSLLLALLWCAQKDLEPGVEDGCWLIPFKGKVTPIPAYKGLVAKAINGGSATSVDPVAVYENDDFFYCYGLEPDLRHTPPKLGTPRGELIGAYVTITLPNGEKKFRVMDREQIEKIRNSGAAWRVAPDSGPWHDWEEAMFLKTIIKQGLKTVPMSPDLRDLLNDDNMIEVGSGVGALLASAGTEVPDELKGPDEEAAKETAAAAITTKEQEKKAAAVFDSLVETELANLPVEEAQARREHLEENLKISAKNTKKTVAAFKIFAAPFFHPYVNEKKEPKEGFWKTFLKWELANYPEVSSGSPTGSPPPEPAMTTVVREGNGNGEEKEFIDVGEDASAAVGLAFEGRHKALVMEILKHPIPIAELGINALTEITPDNIDDLEAKAQGWAATKKKK
jgi:recombination protein RecT